MSTITMDQINSEVNRALKGELSTARVRLRFVSAYVGGQPATPDGIAAFVKHHLHLDGESAEAAVARILNDEVRTTSGGADEIEEKETYGLNVIRRNESGEAYVGTWQVRAMLKQAASRLGLFQEKGKVGSKGDLSEGMVIRPAGDSYRYGIQEIVILRDNKPFADHIYEKFMGNVGTPKGRMSIVHDSEVAPAGCEIEFAIEWPSKRINDKDMIAILGFAQRVGLGSVKAMERGRFEIVSLSID